MDSLFSSCPPPFLSIDDYPATGGYLPGRFCGPLTPNLNCCLPCPFKQWVYSDDYDRKERIASWFNVPALVCQVVLLVTMAALPKERHYLSVGLCVSLILLQMSFIIPLGTQPAVCYNDITPKDMYSSMSCAWSGALLEAGSMAGCIWILLRSLWTHVRVCWDVHHTPPFMWIAHALGWGLPALFLAISLPVTGVSYRLSLTCLPNPRGAFVTWFGWLIAFAGLAALLQFITTGFCLAVFLRSFFVQSTPSISDESGSSDRFDSPGEKLAEPASASLGKRFAWRRVKKVMLLQWRSLLLSILVTIEIIYFGVVYVAQTKAQQESNGPAREEQRRKWSACIILSGGDKNQCMKLAKPLRLAEGAVIGTLFMSALIGLFTFALMFRRSMITGWRDLVSGQKRKSSQNSEGFVMVRSTRVSLGNELGNSSEREMRRLAGVLPSPGGSQTHLQMPEPGDVTRRHETMDFSVLVDEDLDRTKRQVREEDAV